MNKQELYKQIKKKKSFLCIGLDTDIEKIPPHLKSSADAVLEFNCQIIDATHDLCVAYKLNTAFYEALGAAGWQCMAETLNHIPREVFIIADAKRGDIGNTCEQYARAFFQQMNFDAITLSPYMGKDSVKPFLAREGKWAILLALTSNKGAEDFQANGLWQQVIQKSQAWGTPGNMMYVIGATRPAQLAEARKLAPENFLLVPGVGAQGGSLHEVAAAGMGRQCELLVNISRSIVYAGAGVDFAEKARAAALQVQGEMAGLLKG